ncbi:MAG: hypothetical protein AB1499_06640 [Nitrospirota bacterium]
MKQNNYVMTGLCYVPFTERLYAALLLGIILIATGCTSAPLRNARNEFYAGRPDKASEILDKAGKISNRDKLLFLMEKGLILHHQGLYRESTSVLLEASGLIEQQEIINIGRQAGSMVTTEWLTEYKGEYSERLLVHTYLMMDFLLLNDNEAALVEAKQALQVFDKHPESLSDDFFTRGLVALCYENLGLINDAFIEYKKIAELMDNPAPVAKKLYQLAMELGFHDDAELYKKFLPEEDLARVNKKPGTELVLFISRGRSPVKIPGNIIIPPSIRFSFPRYAETESGFFDRVVIDTSAGHPADTISTDVGKVIRASLKERAAMIIAKETARAAAKEAISQQVGNQYDPAAEAVVRGIFFIMEEPDTRCWQTLPARLDLIRIALKKTDQNVTVSIGGEKRTISLTDEEVSSGRRIYRSIRVYN